MLIPPSIHACHTDDIVHILFNACSNQTAFKLQWIRIHITQFAACISDTPVTLKHSQGHQTHNENKDSRQGYNHAKFERSRLNGVREKANAKVFELENMSVISLEHVIIIIITIIIIIIIIINPLTARVVEAPQMILNTCEKSK